MAKRKPGGQKGNSNALKHGFYSAALGPDARRAFEHALTIDPTELREETALMRTALYQLSKIQPENVEVLSLVASRLTRMVALQYGMNKEQQQELHTSFLDLVDQLQRGIYDPEEEDAA